MFSKAKFDLSELKEFHQGLVYGFDPESSVKELEPESIGHLQHLTGQLQDVYNAYLYAQNEILPAIKKIGIHAITSKQLIDWINQIHLRMAFTLAEDVGTQSGKFTDMQVLSWHPGRDFQQFVIRYLSNGLSKNLDLSVVAKTYEIDKKTLQEFLTLLIKIRDDNTITIFPDQKPEIPTQPYCAAGIITLTKLVTQFHKNQLTEKEKSIVEKVVRVCWRPIQLPEKMQEYTNKILQAWRSCDPNNLDDVSKLAQATFIGLTTTHPYFNGNGRTATCLMNLVLRSLGHPSILMRYPSERNNPESSYSKAINEVGKPQLLINHIKNRIGECKQYENKNLAEIATLRVKCYNFSMSIKKEFPEFDLEKNYKNIVSEGQKQIALLTKLWSHSDVMPILKFKLAEEFDNALKKNGLKEMCHFSNDDPENSIIIFALNYMLKLMQEFKEKLTQQRAEKQSIAKLSSVAQKQYTENEKSAIVTQLEQLTEYKGWKTYKANGLTILLDFSDREQAEKVVAKLNTIQALQVKLNFNTNTQKYAVRIDSINTEKLLAIKLLNNDKQSIISYSA